MPSDKLTRILKSAGSFTAEQIALMTDAEGWNWVYSQRSPRKEKLPAVCLTGFTPLQKEELSKLATKAGLRVVSEVSALVCLLCTGDNPGPVKLAKARDHGIPILTRAEFLQFLDAGELLAK